MTGALNQEELLQQALALSRAEYAKDLQALIANKVEDLRCYDVPNMERAVAICHWGRSGSLLLASYLDGHDDVVMLPAQHGEVIYDFFERFQSWSLRDKLIAYPLFTARFGGPVHLTGFFQGDFKISAADYYAAIAALFDVYGNNPSLPLETRRTFFQFLHVAYSLALGRRPASRHPLMVYAQHWWNDVLAHRFVDDFPQARFLHTVRDPISNFDRTFDAWGSVGTLYHLVRSDHPHPGTASRTRAVRLEDLHTNLQQTISRVLDWLDLPYHINVSKSTFNGIPYVVERAGVSWSGSRPEQAQRSSQCIRLTDKAILFALFYENFVAWDYHYPRLFEHALFRGLAVMLALPLPMKSELIGARVAVQAELLPSIRLRNFGAAFGCLLRICKSRIVIINLVFAEFGRRMIFGKAVLELI